MRDEESGEDMRETASEEEAYEVPGEGPRLVSTIVGGNKADKVAPLSSSSLWACAWPCHRVSEDHLSSPSASGDVARRYG